MVKNKSEQAKEELIAIEKLISGALSIRPGELHSRTQQHRVAHARFMVWSILHCALRWSTPKIGAAYDRDHSTIVDGLKRARQMGTDIKALTLWKKSQ